MFRSLPLAIRPKVQATEARLDSIYKAASMGLKQIQHIANDIQLTDTPAWWENLDDRVEQLKHACETELTEINTWLTENAS